MGRRGKNLSTADIQAIVEILDGWTGPLSWNLLIDQIFTQLHRRYTRQALHKHERVRLAFAGYRDAGAKTLGNSSKPRSKELRASLERIARLEAENSRLMRENNALLEQFVRWAYNAHSRGLTEDFLNQPLMPVDRR